MHAHGRFQENIRTILATDRPRKRLLNLLEGSASLVSTVLPPLWMAGYRGLYKPSQSLTTRLNLFTLQTETATDKQSLVLML